jgi:cellulose synthase/poly-beta-1,6-N-acetylglucosamine synthase-like glycosyltransferase
MTLFFYLLLSVVFWGCLILIGHTYALYPMLLGFLARGKSLPAERFERDEEFPEVAVLMAVYNEEAVLEATLASILASDYPAGKMKVYIGSD